MGDNSSTDSYVEGIGDEVVIAASTFLMLILPILFYVIRKLMSTQGQEIHPDHREQVSTTRSHLGLDSPDVDQQEPNEDNDVNHEREIDQSHSDQRCPICLQDARLPVETNCGHLFCAQCIVAYWRYGNWLGAVRCPVCRQQVSLLMRNFPLAETNTEGGIDALNNINDYNRRFSGQPRPLLDHIRDIPALLRHLWSEFFSMSGLVVMFRIRITLCAVAIFLYLISPLDFLPEAVFGAIGLLDDAFVLMLLLIYMTVIYRNVVAARGG